MNNFMNIPELIFKLGGTGSVSKLLKTNPSTISNWKKNNKIPKSYMNKLDILLKEKNLITFTEYENNTRITPFKKKSRFSILVIISGGVSCYKVLELLRLYHKNNFDIDVVLTESAQKFITPLVVTSLISKKCYTELFSSEEEENMNHINLARNKDLILVAPCTANFIAKITHGIADDLASNIILASNSKILIAPSMNPYMWENKATQDNLKTLKQRGVVLINPNSGVMACGENGTGRLPDISEIFSYTTNYLLKKEIKRQISFQSQLKVLITAGPTREKIDPVRYISNRSSGKMGFSIAEAARDEGGLVSLISGPVSLKTPDEIKRINVESADEMFNEVNKVVNNFDFFISTAAVADFKPEKIENQKIKKEKKSNNLSMELIENKDILKSISLKKGDLKVIGFAAETQDVVKNAKKKLNEKKLDLIIANDVSDSSIGFDSDENEVYLITKKIEKKIEKISKKKLSRSIIEFIAKYL